MSNKEALFKCLTDQRYYHFVALRDNGRYSLPVYWRQIGDVAPLSGEQRDVSTSTSEVQHRQLKLPKPYARGGVLQAISKSKDGSPPYLYDLFGIKTRLGRDAFFVLVFPFAGLALDMVTTLIAQHNLLRAGELQRVDLGTLVKCFENGAQTEFHDLISQVVALQFVVADDKCLSGMRLGGDDPLNSKIYRESLRPEVKRGFLHPDLCVLSCEQEWRRATHGDDSQGHGTIRSRLHIDAFGNFKFYVHIGCCNIPLIPYALGLLYSLKCLQKTSGNPLLRLSQDELGG
jgi:hypothetical protein